MLRRFDSDGHVGAGQVWVGGLPDGPLTLPAAAALGSALLRLLAREYLRAIEEPFQVLHDEADDGLTPYVIVTNYATAEIAGPAWSEDR